MVLFYNEVPAAKITLDTVTTSEIQWQIRCTCAFVFLTYVHKEGLFFNKYYLIQFLLLKGNIKMQYSDVHSDTASVLSNDLKSSNFYLASLLGALKFFSVNRDRPGVFVSTYLLLAGWKESK